VCFVLFCSVIIGIIARVDCCACYSHYYNYFYEIFTFFSFDWFASLLVCCLVVVVVVVDGGWLLIYCHKGRLTGDVVISCHSQIEVDVQVHKYVGVPCMIRY
jgi:hypothetical protein